MKMTAMTYKQFVTLLVLCHSATYRQSHTEAFVLPSPSSLSSTKATIATPTTTSGTILNHDRIRSKRYMQGNDEFSTNSLNRECNNSEKKKKNSNGLKEDLSFELKAASVAANLMEQGITTNTANNNNNINMNDNSAATLSMEKRIEKLTQWISEGLDDVIPGSLGKVISSALLITSNTVGASMMVIPTLASGPGMVVSSGLIFSE